MKKHYQEYPSSRDFWEAGVYHDSKKTFPIEFYENGNWDNSTSSLLKNVISLFREWTGFVPLPCGGTGDDEIGSDSSNSLRTGNLPLTRRGFRRRLAGILYADIADYVRCTEQDEEGTHSRFLECMKIMKAQVTAKKGKVAHFAGDAILVEFNDADSALQCAIDVQVALKTWNSSFNKNRQLWFRIGVNYGEIITDHSDIYGNAVNLAARLEGLAEPGGICVSSSIRSNLGNRSPYKFVALGKQHVKNIGKPVDAFWIEINTPRVVNARQPAAAQISAVTS